MRSSEKGKINATRYLLAQGALPDSAGTNRLSPLLRAVERNHVAIVHMLLEHDASPETADKKGRTALMTAAWKNHWHILNSLIGKGADVNAKDERGRNVLHNLAADKQCDWGDSVIELLLKTNIYIDGEAGQDKLGRTPLHWACATGKLHLAELLLNRAKLPRANVHATEIRGKTSLHLAAAHDWDYIVDMLLRHGADVHARSDGAWTPLHNACEVGCIKIVRTLIKAESDVNAKLLNGMTPLHLAAQGGHVEVVKALLECRDIKRAARDTFGSTPFLRAAQNKRKDIVNLLAPFNHMETLSEDAIGACNGFNVSQLKCSSIYNSNPIHLTSSNLYLEPCAMCHRCQHGSDATWNFFTLKSLLTNFTFITSLTPTGDNCGLWKLPQREQSQKMDSVWYVLHSLHASKSNQTQNFSMAVIPSTLANQCTQSFQMTRQQNLDGFISQQTTWLGSRSCSRSSSSRRAPRMLRASKHWKNLLAISIADSRVIRIS